MAIKQDRYKDIYMYSSFPYIREVSRGVVSATPTQWGSYEINTSVAMPSSVRSFPAYVRSYVEYPSGVFSPVQGTDGLLVGWTNTRIYFFGFYNPAPFDQIFRVHYFVYDRLEI